MSQTVPLLFVLFLVIQVFAAATHARDVDSMTPDLETPLVFDGPPAPGRRVRQFNDGYEGTDVYHALYLPTDWRASMRYPVIVEYSGNAYQSSLGVVEECDLGYGITAGRGAIWVSLPFVNRRDMKNASTWWGDVNATVDYCKRTVERICKDHGGDRNDVFIAGFSRGAIACNYIGLYDDEIAKLWRGFICHSHYDGVRRWGYAGSDRESANARLKRLGSRPQFISHENNIDQTRAYLLEAFPEGNFTFQAIHGVRHTDTWVLRDIPERKAVRDWFKANVCCEE